MDIKELREQREILENNLNNSAREFIGRFESKTGVSIKDISVETEEGFSPDADRKNYQHSISVTLDI